MKACRPLCRLAYAAAGVKGRQDKSERLQEHRTSAELLQGLPRVGVFRQVPVLMRSWQRTLSGPSRTPAITVDAATRSIGEF